MNNMFFVSGLNANAPKEAFRQISLQLADDIQIDAPRLYDALCLINKEDHAGIGRGLAVPQGRLPFLSAPIYIVATLNKGIDFDALDHKFVDLIVIVLSPDADVKGHLSRLAYMSRTLKDDDFCNRLRGCDNVDSMRAVMMAEDLDLLRAA